MSIDISTWFSDDDKDVMESFLKSNPNEKNLVAGLFYAGDGSEEARQYNRAISYFFERFARIYYNVLDWMDLKNKNKAAEIGKKIEDLKKKINELSDEFVKFLEGELDSEYALLEDKIKDKGKEDFLLISQEQSPIEIYYVAKKDGSKGEFSIYYVDKNFQEDVEKIIEELSSYEYEDEDEELINNEFRKKFVSVSLRATKILLEGLFNVASDQEVKEFIKFLINLVELSLKKDEVRKYVLPRFLKLRVDPYFAFPEEENSGEVLNRVGYITHKPLIAWLGYFPSPLSEKEVLERIGEKLLPNWTDIYSKNKEEALNKVRRKLKSLEESLGSDPNYWLSKLYGEDSETFLRKMRETLHLILKGKVNTVKSAAFGKTGNPENVAKREYYIKGSKKRVLLFISERFPENEKEEIENGIKKFYETLKEGNKYLQTKGKIVEDRFIYFDFIFPDWVYLKEKEKERNKYPDWDKKFLAFLLQLGAFTKALIKYGEDKGVEFIPVFLLNVGGDGEDEKIGELQIWDVVRTFYNHAYPIPAQTIKKDTLKKLNQKGALYIIKNAFLSAIFSKKVLKLKFEKDLNTKIKKIYVVIENSTIKIGKEPHRVYHVYFVELTNNELKIEFKDVFYIFADGVSGDAREFQSFLSTALDHNYAVICISSDENSPLFKISPLGKVFSFYPTLYKERKIQVDMKKKEVLGKHAYFIFEKDFKPFLRYVGHKEIGENSEDFMLVGVKPPFAIPPKLKEEPYVNSVLSLFFIKNFKGESPINQEVIIYALLSWLSFLSESYQYGFVKPKFMQKKLLYVSISRKKKIGENVKIPRVLKLNSGALITELAFLVRRSLMGKFVDNIK